MGFPISSLDFVHGSRTSEHKHPASPATRLCASPWQEIAMQIGAGQSSR
jgi:hypothetical protein